MHTFRIPATLATCLVLSACGAAPSPVQAPTPGGGGGDLVGEIAAEAETEAAPEGVQAPLEPATPPASPAALTGNLPTPTPSAIVTPPTTSAGPNGPTATTAPAATPTPTATATPAPTPTPSATATPAPANTRTLTVLGDRHLVTLSRYQTFGTSPFEIVSVEANAYNRPGVKFPALAGASRGRGGWKYARITPESAKDWSGDVGGSGEVFFLDSTGGEDDNSGSWVVLEQYDDGKVVHETRTEISATADVNGFNRDNAAYMNLGPAAATWAITAAWEGAVEAPFSYSDGCFVVYTRPDGVRDFAVVGLTGATIQAKGDVYAFFVTSPNEQPDGNLRFTLTRQ
ncbi:MAG: hypothetical protein ACK46X_21050 [Candidatus Sericytochromatia bacterium]